MNNDIIETVPAQYLYKMDDTAYFMNTETYDQYEIPVVNVENELLYILKTRCEDPILRTEVIGYRSYYCRIDSCRNSTIYQRCYCTGSGKPATMETGLVVNVPTSSKQDKNSLSTLQKELRFSCLISRKRHSMGIEEQRRNRYRPRVLKKSLLLLKRRGVHSFFKQISV